MRLFVSGKSVPQHSMYSLVRLESCYNVLMQLLISFFCMYRQVLRFKLPIVGLVHYNAKCVYVRAVIGVTRPRIYVS